MKFFSVTIGSLELGQREGCLNDLDEVVAQVPREQLANFTIDILNGLFADRSRNFRAVSLGLASMLGTDGLALRRALSVENTVFLEPMQQLVLLRRILTVDNFQPTTMEPGAILRLFADASRIASDLLRRGDQEKQILVNVSDTERALRVASSLLVRQALLNPPHPTQWLARLRLMFRELPKLDARAQAWADRLRVRFVDVFGLSFEEVGRMVQILGLWTMRFQSLPDFTKQIDAVAIDVEAFLSQTNLPRDNFMKFLDRTSLPLDAVLSDASLGGPLSILPFRDRPFLRLSERKIAAIYPSLIAEKLTYDFFWWTVDPAKKQEQVWQREWGDLVELYVVQVLRDIAAATGCEFKGDIRFDGGQIDAAMWFKGHVALFEISAGMMSDAAGNNGDWEELKAGLTRTLLRSTSKGKEKDEAIAQVVRDARKLLSGDLNTDIRVETVTQVYPVVIVIDRRAQTAPLRVWFDEVFATETTGVTDKSKLAPLAVIGLEDLEKVEQLIKEGNGQLKGTPPGLLRLLRRWQMQRDSLKTKGKAGSWGQFVSTDIGNTGPNARLQAEADQWLSELETVFF